MNKLQDKIYKNALMCSKITSLSKDEKKNIVNKLLQTRTQRELAEELDVGQGTIFDWKSARDYSNESKQISLNLIYSKIKQLDPKTITDWGRLEQIKEVIENLLRNK